MSTNIFEYKGYSFVQTSYNWHYRLFNDAGHMVVHAQADHKMSESEAKKAIEAYEELCGAISIHGLPDDDGDDI